MTILLTRLQFLSRFRDRTSVRFAKQFIRNVKEDSHNTIADTRLIEDGYNGFDSARDTDEEVATASRCGPDVFTRRKERFQFYPIPC